MPELLMLKGLPGSGKSTYAKSLKGYKRVNMDDLRRMLDDGKYTKANEKLVQQMRYILIGEILLEGHNVVVDDTNFAEKHANKLKQTRDIANQQLQAGIGKGGTVTYREHFVDTPLKDCITNDLKREHSVGKDVIMRMYNQYLKPPALDQEWDQSLPSCVIVDIDGTVAKMINRGPYEWSKVGDDAPKYEIIELVGKLNQDHQIIFMSGRDSVCRTLTEQWLYRYVMPALEKDSTAFNGVDLYMRPEGDQRKDTIIKQELYEEHVKGKYNVHLVLDDRNCMVDHWRDQGFTCLQVAPGEF